MIQAMVIVVSFFLVGLIGCSNPEKREAEANAEIAEEKVKFMQKYGDCLEKYEGQEDVTKKCAPYKEATDAMIKK
jgi:hypothetical protein